MSLQLPLIFESPSTVSFDNFYAGQNQEVVALLNACSQAKMSVKSLYLWGGAGTGKTHLLQAVCLQCSKHYQAAYIPLQNHAMLSPSIFDGLETYAMICIDDLQAIVGDMAWESALFHLYNRLDQTSTQLIVTGTQSLAHLGLQLSDLQSRLGWYQVHRLYELDDDEKMLALQRRADERGIELTTQVSQYLLSHYPRNLVSLLALLDELDKASLVEQRKLTIPFVKYWFNTRKYEAIQ